MFSVVVLTALLGLFSVNQATLPDCMELITPLTLEDDYKSIMGKWIFLKGIADHHSITDFWNTVNSSWVKFGPRNPTLANTVKLQYGSMLKGKCEFQTINVVFNDSTFNVIDNDIISEGKFLPSCQDCLTISFVGRFKDETIKTLHLFKKKRNPRKLDMDRYWKQAECLGLKREVQYSYDGVTKLCHVAKDSSSDKKPSLE